MYSFIDTTESQSSADLPSEALKINGVYIENEISGYRTLYVSGREAMSPELTTYETGIRDGALMQNKRYPPRTITVGYQLITKSTSAFREAYNKLNQLLNVEEVELIFADEPDKFFIGTPSEAAEPEPGSNAVKSEFRVLCTDPFKYSIQEYEAGPTADDGSTFVIDYKGTYKSFPKLEAAFYEENEAGDDGETPFSLTGNGDCGYVAFFDSDGHIIQLGDPDEEDTESYEKSQTLINQSWKEVKAWTTALNALWIKNAGRVSESFKVQTGTSGFILSDTTGDYGYYLTAKSYGSNESGYHGPTVTRMLPADASGETGAADWTFSWSMKVNIGKASNANNNCGCIQLLLCNSDNIVIGGMSIFKSGSGNKATMRMYVKSKIVKDVSIDLSYNNKRFGTNNPSKGITTVKSCSIIKSGSNVTFNLGGSKYSFSDSTIEELLVTKFTIAFGQYKSKPVLPWIGVYRTKFVKNNCDTWRDIPNKFSSNDVVIADCKTGKILLNDALTPEYGTLGNDWENFCLKPGQNQIGTSCSSWVSEDYFPKFKVRYREVFL